MKTTKAKPKKPAPKKSAGARTSQAAPSIASIQSSPSTAPREDIPFTETTLYRHELTPGYNARAKEERTPEALADLIQSIESLGIQNRLWCWKLPTPTKAGATHEIIGGECRYTAHGFTTRALEPIPVRIYDCSQKQALALGLIDNIQRQQLSEIDEAFAYRKMIDEAGFVAWDEKNPAHSLAHRLGKSKTGIYKLLKLVELPKLGIEAIRSGQLSVSVAARLARIPNEPKRKEFIQRAISNRWTDDQTAQYIEREAMTELKGAPFDRKDATLNPERGSCDKCPYRSGNQAELYPDMAKGRGDICTDPVCYRLKCAHAFELRAKAHQALGGRVLTAKEAEEIGLNKWGSYAHFPWLNLADQAQFLDKPAKTYRELLAPALEKGDLLPTLAMANDGTGQHFELVTREDALRLAKKLKVVPKNFRDENEEDQEENRESWEDQRKRYKARNQHWLDAIAAAAGDYDRPTTDFLRSLVKYIAIGRRGEYGEGLDTDLLAESLQLDSTAFQLAEEEDDEHGWGLRALRAAADAATEDGQLLTMLFRVMAYPDDSRTGELPETSRLAAECLGLDPAKLEAEAAAAFPDPHPEPEETLV